MLGGKFLKCTGMVTLFFFVFFTFAVDFAVAQKDEDALLKARRLYQDGDYEGSIKLLSDFITKLRAMVEQKKNVAEAFYLLAKIYYEVGDDTKVNENLRKCFETFPAFTMEEPNLGFKDRVNQVKKEVLQEKTKEPLPETEEFVEEEQPPVEKKVIPQPAPSPKKKKKFPVLLVLGGAVVIGVVLALALGGKKKEEENPFDIRGDWTIKPDYYAPIYMSFTGSRTSGTFVDDEGYRGSYEVTNRQVRFSYYDMVLIFTGAFSDVNNMSGEYVYEGAGGSGSGTWTGTRGFVAPKSSTASSLKAQGAHKN